MGKRFTETGKYHDKWFRRLPPMLKLGWDYLYHVCDPAGVIELDSEHGDFVIGGDVPWDDLLEAAGDRIEVLPSGRWWIKRFIQFQYGKLSKDCKPHVPVLALLDKHGISLADVPQSGQFKSGNVTERMKRDLYKRDDNTCCYCGAQFDSYDLVPDHVAPTSKGGRDNLDNLVAACVPCNQKKAAIDVEEFILSLPDPQGASERLMERLPERVLFTLKEKDKDKDKDKEKDKVKVKESGDQISRIESPILRTTASEWLDYKRERRESYKPTGLKGFVSRLLTLAEEHGDQSVCQAIQRAMANGWKGFEHDLGGSARGSPRSNNDDAADEFMRRIGATQ